MLEFLHEYISTYDIVTDILFLLLTIFLLAMTFITRPERTYMLKLCLSGIVTNIIMIIFHMAMLAETIYMRETHSETLFYVLYSFYLLFYMATLSILVLYIEQLSYRRRTHALRSYILTAVYTVFYIIIMYKTVWDQSAIVYEDGIYKLTSHSNDYVWAGVLAGTIIMVTTYKNLKDIPRVVLTAAVAFVPVDVIVLSLQFFFPESYFVCATVVLPFFIFFMLFHMNKFDETTGCQTQVAEVIVLDRYIHGGKKFLFMEVDYFLLRNRDYNEIKNVYMFVENNLSRRIENLKSGLRIYSAGKFTHHVLTEVKSNEEAERLKQQIIDTLNTTIEYEGVTLQSHKNIVVSSEISGVENVDVFMALIDRKRRTFSSENKDKIIEVSEDDYIKYKQDAIIEKALLDINEKGNLDDERVLVYVQPIYCIETESFRTGEALMRMNIDGKMYFPNDFIPIAESIDCIHTLTRIMLNKVAHKIVQLTAKYDLEAITVNVSTMEMTDPNASEEFYGIIRDAGADPSKIRLEITESTSIFDYQTIIHNIERLNEKNVHFYLDDFGTGYSNMERITSIPFKTIKFDKSLLYRALSDSKSKELFEVLLAFFKKNGFKTVIEGVEDDEQRNYVSQIGFDYIQGYFYSKPVPVVEVDRFYSAK